MFLPFFCYNTVMKKIVIFVCNGNIHRSVIAAQCFRNVLKKHGLNSRFVVDSYGLQGTQGTTLPKHKRLSDYPKEWKAANPTLQKLKINISDHSYQKITINVVKKAEVVIAMDNKVYSSKKNSLTKQFPNQIKKIHVFSELTSHHKYMKDPVKSNDKKLHKKIIKSIYSTLNKNYKIILTWVK